LRDTLCTLSGNETGQGDFEKERPMADEQAEDLDLIQRIENHIITVGNFGIDPRIFQILDNTDSAEQDIASIEKMIDVNLSLRLRNMANSVYYGMQRRGKLKSFYDVITSIGMQPAKLFIVAMALFNRLDSKHKILDVESFATSLFSKILAEQMNMSVANMDRAEIGGLFLNLGKVAIGIFETAEMVDLEPEFIEKHHRQFALMIIEKFLLPDYLQDLILEDRLVLQRNAFSVHGVIYLAQSLVEKILRDHGLIAFKSPMPEVRDNLETTLGLKISEYFNLIGLDKYLKIVRI
jgi:HD-like signal output (HDOD) protein